MSERDQITRRVALGGGAAGLAAALLAACGGSSQATGTTETVTAPAAAVFGTQPGFRFTIVNHAAQSDVFTPTQNGVADACTLLGCSYEWVGSENGDITTMVDAIGTAVSAKVDGIATTIVDRTAFGPPTAAASRAGIPVIAYNADAGRSSRLAYVGGDAARGGRRMGERIRNLLPVGGRIAVFVSNPGISNFQARLQGLRAALRGSGIGLSVVASGSGSGEQLTVISQYLSANPHLNGVFGLDGGSTGALANALQNAKAPSKGMVSGGYDLTPSTQQLLAAGVIDFAIDEQLYLQGFLPVLELYLHRVSAGLTGPADVDTGARFVDRRGAAAYNDTQSRFEGTGTSPGLQSNSG